MNKLKSYVPLYLHIKDDILGKINRSEWINGMMIPPEIELSKSYNVSRVTIRKSLNEIEKLGLLERKAGFGSIIQSDSRNSKNFTVIKSETSIMNEMGVTLHNYSSVLSKVKSDAVLSSIFNIDLSSELYCLKRVRGGHRPILISTSYLLPIISIDDSVLSGSLYAYLAQKGIFFESFDETISAVQSTNEHRSTFDIKKDIPILKRVRRSYNSKHIIIEYSETFYDSTAYEYRNSITLKSM